MVSPLAKLTTVNEVSQDPSASGGTGNLDLAIVFARRFVSLPPPPPNCGADRHVIALITEAAPLERTLT